MTPQDLLQHLRSEGDSAHTAIPIYLETLCTFSQGHVRQDPGVNSKKKPQSEEEEKEEVKEEEEGVATALDGTDVSHEHVDMNACDHSKQGLETQIASETQLIPNQKLQIVVNLPKMYQMTQKRMLLMLQDQRKLWVEVSIPKMNFPTRILI
jgi:hypothetical protein